MAERESRSRPTRDVFRSIGGRTAEITAAGSPTSTSTKSPNDVHDGRSIGIYGLSRYGRCVYGSKRGIYGTDKYGRCSYWGTGERFGDYANGDYIDVSNEGFITLFGSARAWKCVDLDPSGVKKGAAAPPAEDAEDGFAAHRFDRATEESVYFTWQVPHDFAEGTGSVRGRFGFIVQNPPATVDENVRMGFEYKRLTNGSIFDFSSGTSTGYLDTTIYAGETAKLFHYTSLGVCDTTDWCAGDAILFRFYRDATAAEDTYDSEAVASNNDVWVGNYHLEYLFDKLGEAS